MNYLSHFYLVRDNADPYLVLGMLLPDMVKNHRKNWTLHPRKQARQLEGQPALRSMLLGWELHLETDRRFHSSTFFSLHSSTLRKDIAVILTRPPFRPFFLAHIALELLLDNLLISDAKVDVDMLYHQLSRCDPGEITRFLEISQAPEAPSFNTWFSHFIAQPYLHSYGNISSLSYALDRTGQRVWTERFSGTETVALTALLAEYRLRLAGKYERIFEEIAGFLR